MAHLKKITRDLWK